MVQLVMYLGLDFVGENGHGGRDPSRKTVAMNSRRSITGVFGKDRAIGATGMTVHLPESDTVFSESGKRISHHGTGNGILWRCARGDAIVPTEQLLY